MPSLAGAVAVAESAHRRESAARPDLSLLGLLRERASDEVDFEALSIALPRCELIACDARPARFDSRIAEA